MSANDLANATALVFQAIEIVSRAIEHERDATVRHAALDALDALESARAHLKAAVYGRAAS